MLYPKNIEVKIGFDKIRELLSEECVSSLGRSFVQKMKFADSYDQVRKLVAQTDEFRLILVIENQFPNQHYLDVSAALARASIDGTYLDTEQFFDIKLSLRTIQQIIHFFKNKEEGRYPQLTEMMLMAIPMAGSWTNLIQQIDRIINERGQVRDNASPELAEIRRKLVAEQNAIRRTLERIYKTAKNSGWIGDGMSLSVRDGRLVIPILAEHKRKLKGFIHDETASGNMAFVEPAEVLEANNEIRDLEIRERREIIRILEALTDALRPHIPELKKAYQFLGLMDFIRAKAKFALKTDATAPLLSDKQLIDWKRAFHPLLVLSHKKIKKEVVPLTVHLGNENRILLVSGPNAGGKSVLLKTIGLLQYMVQCGLLIPVSPDSEIGIFKNLFIDIGDEQSIENDLSTYSSHLTNMKHFLQFSDRKSLFLIDEFGTGTEPNLGGAIAESILEQLLKSKAVGLVNTHYTNLKIFADRNEGMVNGAMKFDAEHLEPLYELEVGKPGSSFALEVAQKIGLPKAVIKNAENKLGTQQVDFEKLIKELEIEKKVFAERNKEFLEKTQRLQSQLSQYTGLKEFLEIEQKKIIFQAKEEAKRLIKETNKQIESTIREIKETKADKEATKIAREILKDFEESELKITKKEEKLQQAKTNEPEWKIEVSEIGEGSFVRLKGQETVGQVLGIKGKDIEIAIGSLKTTVKANRLEKVTKKEFKEATKESPRAKLGGIDMNEKMANFSFNLDIRGKRGEEAIAEVDNLMNDAILLGYDSLRIVHGKGDGILRNVVRLHLRNYKQVRSVADEHPERGGHGVTLVALKA